MSHLRLLTLLFTASVAALAQSPTLPTHCYVGQLAQISAGTGSLWLCTATDTWVKYPPMFTCATTPPTTGVYKDQCLGTDKSVYTCANSGGCTVSGDWGSGGGGGGGLTPAGNNGDVQTKNGSALAAGGMNCTSTICTVGTTVLCNDVNAQTGTSYTLLASDNGCTITLNNASSITLTIPAGLPKGFTTTIIQLGAGTVTPTASGVTLRQRQSLTKTAGQYAVASLTSYVSNVFVFTGDIQP